MAKDQEKAARQSYAAKAKDKGHRATKFQLEGFGSSAPIPPLSLATKMAENNRSKMAGDMRVDGMRTPTLL